jgi:dihydrofolate synthase/folylpolyglutamate synthase
VISHPILRQLADRGVKLGLDEIRSFLQALGEPHRAYPVVHIAGTNGKGSVATMVTHALVRAGYRVGTNTSPHLEHVGERIRLDGVPLDDGALADGIERLDRARLDWARSQGRAEPPLTYFEFLTALAFQVFAERQVDVAVVEVGLGGRLDATNVVKPTITAITSIGLDHMEQLGPDLPSIAREKAGICKPGAPLILGSMAPEARDAILEIAQRVQAPTWVPGRQLARERRKSGWRITTPDGVVEDLQLAMEGEHQGANAMVAVGVLHGLRRLGFHIPDAALREGVSEARIAGRLEPLLPGLWADGAHNPDGTRALAAWLAARPRPASRILLFGMGSERDPSAVIEPLLPHFDEVVATRCAHPKARDSMELAAALQDLDVVLSDGGPIEEALPEVYAEADEVVVAGSLYLVGAARTLVREGALAGIAKG